MHTVDGVGAGPSCDRCGAGEHPGGLHWFPMHMHAGVTGGIGLCSRGGFTKVIAVDVAPPK